MVEHVGTGQGVVSSSGTRGGQETRVRVDNDYNEDSGAEEYLEQGGENVGALDEVQVQGFCYKLSDEVKQAIASYDGPGEIIITARGEVLAQLYP